MVLVAGASPEKVALKVSLPTRLPTTAALFPATLNASVVLGVLQLTIAPGMALPCASFTTAR